MKYNVLQLIDSFNQGGTERQTVQLTRLLHESNRYRVRIAALSGKGVLRSEIERLGLHDIPEFPLTSFYDRNMMRQLRRFVRYLRETEIDLVHAHDFYTNIFGMIGAWLAGVPVRIASRRETDGIRTTRQRRVERSAYRLAHAVVANADAVRQQLIGEGVRADKIAVVYNGLDTARLKPRADLQRTEVLTALNLPTDERLRFVTIVANMLHPMKDQRTFLRAARRVRASVPEARFVLAGEGGLQESYKEFAAELGLAQDAFFTGRCAQVADLLSVSDVCVLSSCGVEGFSNSIIEYMAVARAVVATDIGGAREQVRDGETGYIVSPGDAEVMAERIISLLRDPARARIMGERGRQIVEKEFSCEAQLERTESLYERLLLAGKAHAAVPALQKG